MELACSRLDDEALTDSCINIVFENAQLLKEEDIGREALMKYWLPTTFPSKVNFVITTEAGSPLENYFSTRNCHKIEIKSQICQASFLRNRIIQSDIRLRSIQSNEVLLQVFEQYPEYLKNDLIFNRLFFKILMAKSTSIEHLVLGDCNELKNRCTFSHSIKQVRNSNELLNCLVSEAAHFINEFDHVNIQLTSFRKLWLIKIKSQIFSSILIFQ